MVPTKVMVPSARLAFTSKLKNSHDHTYDIESFEKRTRSAENKWLSYQKQISKVYNKQVRPRTLCVDNLILKAAMHVQKALVPRRLFLNVKDLMLFEKPLKVVITLSLGLIQRITWNVLHAKWLKMHYL